jgi:hypothetical protein
LFDMKLSAAAAGAAFVLSLLIGLISGGTFLFVLVRAAIFGALFFGFAVGSHMLLSRFLPELLGLSGTETKEGDSEVGSRIDLVVGDDGGPMEAGTETIERPRKRVAAEEEAEEIEAFLPADGVDESAARAGEAVGLDQGGEGRYTERKDTDGVPFATGGKGAEPALPPGLIDDVDVLPDLETMSDSFVSPLVEEAAERSASEPFQSKPSPTYHGAETGGDFDPREMASAIQTILKRDQKG